MPIPGVHVETLFNPARYSQEQIEAVCRVAGQVNRGRFILCEAPALCARCLNRPETFCVLCGTVAEE